MDNESCDQSEQMRGAGSASRRTVVAAVMAAGLVLAAKGSTVAAGKLGGAGGADEFRTVCPVLVAGKLGGASGVDAFGSSTSVGSESGNGGSGLDRCDESMRSSGSV